MTDRCRNCGRDHTGPLCWAAAAAAQFQPRQQALTVVRVYIGNRRVHPEGRIHRFIVRALIRDLRDALRWTHRSDG